MAGGIDETWLSARLRQLGTAWGAIRVLPEVDSTNSELARRGKPGDVVLSLGQRHGRGRLDRAWTDTPGASLALSAMVSLPPAAVAGWVPLIAGLATADAIEQVAAIATGLKWPNDVLTRTGERKLAGILCEVRGGADPGVIVGIGVNLAQSPEQLPTPQAGSLALAGAAEVDPGELAVVLLSGLGQLLGDIERAGQVPEQLRAAYLRACVTVGREVELSLPDGGTRRATATGIDDDGRLVVADPQIYAVSAADVVHVRSAAVPPEDVME